jgi:hypothetical protein
MIEVGSRTDELEIGQFDEYIKNCLNTTGTAIRRTHHCGPLIVSGERIFTN